MKQNYKALATNISKFFVEISSGNLGNAAKEALDTIAQLDPHDDAKKRIKNLAERSILLTFYEVFRPNLDIYGVTLDDIRAVNKKTTYSDTIDYSKIDTLSDLKSDQFITQIQTVYEKFISEFAITQSTSKERIRSYFISSLYQEWRNAPSYYGAIQKSTETPFDDDERSVRERHEYRNFLMAQAYENVFGQNFGLKEIYVSLRGKFDTDPDDEEAEHNVKYYGDKAKPQDIFDVESVITKWCLDTTKNDYIKIITGGPGSGKSSLSKVFASNLCKNDDIDVIFVPLHLINTKIEFRVSIQRFISDIGFFSTEQYPPANKTVIILDGLDELEMIGKTARDIVYEFIQDVQNDAMRVNHAQERAKFIITGREIAVQSAKSIIRSKHSVIELLPYFIRSDYVLAKKEDSLKDQRNEWWKRYGLLVGKNYNGLPNELRHPDLDSITAQPLLNYLVALSFERGALIFSKSLNVNLIYADLLSAVYQRGWAQSNHPAVSDLSEDLFQRLLEEVALAAWHGVGRRTTIAEIRQACSRSNLTKNLEALEEGAKGDVSRLMLAFYFRQKGIREGEGEKTFEFSHKSFGEFLLSRRIIRLIEKCNTQFDRAQLNADDGWNSAQALVEWTKIFGKSQLDNYIIRFIEHEIKTHDKDKVYKFQLTLNRLLTHLVDDGLPDTTVETRESQPVIEYLANVFGSLVVTMSACAKHSERKNNLKFKTQNMFGYLLKICVGQRVGPQSSYVLRHFSNFVFEKEIFDATDFYGADLEGSVFERCQLNICTFERSNMSGTVFKECACYSTDFKGAHCSNTSFNSCDLTYCDFRDCKIENFLTCDFREARIVNAIFDQGVKSQVIALGADNRGKYQLLRASKRRRRKKSKS